MEGWGSNSSVRVVIFSARNISWILVPTSKVLKWDKVILGRVGKSSDIAIISIICINIYIYTFVWSTYYCSNHLLIKPCPGWGSKQVLAEPPEKLSLMHKAIHLHVPGHWDLRSIVMKRLNLQPVQKRLGNLGGVKKFQAVILIPLISGRWISVARVPKMAGQQPTWQQLQARTVGPVNRGHQKAVPTQSHRGWKVFGWKFSEKIKGIQGLIISTYGILWPGRLFLGWVG